MSAIFILLLFSEKTTKPKKESKKKLSFHHFLFGNTNKFTLLFLLINYAVKKKLQCRERKKGENERFSFPSSLNIHNIFLFDAFCRCLFQFGATTSHIEKLLATRKSLNPVQREEEGVLTPRKQVLGVCHTLRMIFKARLDLHPQPTPCQNPPYCVKLVVLSQQCAMLLTRAAKCIAFF